MTIRVSSRHLPHARCPCAITYIALIVRQRSIFTLAFPSFFFSSIPSLFGQLLVASHADNAYKQMLIEHLDCWCYGKREPNIRSLCAPQTAINFPLYAVCKQPRLMSESSLMQRGLEGDRDQYFLWEIAGVFDAGSYRTLYALHQTFW